jgi:hypothetical protein
MLVVSWSLTLICGLLIQTGTAVQAPDCLQAADRIRLEKETKLDNRIQIYEEASIRCQHLVTNMVQHQDFQFASGCLQSWGDLIEKSLHDVETSTVRKEKSRALKKYEIHLRKAVSAIQELKLKGTVDQFDAFEAWLNRAEHVRKKFVDFLFPR